MQQVIDSQAMMHNKAIAASGAVGVGAGAVPTETFPSYLGSHYFLDISYAEWIQIIGAVWVVILIFDWLYKRVKNPLLRLIKRVFR